jgi:hypothetical protein
MANLDRGRGPERIEGMVEVMARAPKCPVCGAATIPVRRGFPSAKTMEEAEEGKVFLGGCLISPKQPDRICTGTEQHFLRDGQLFSMEEDS